MVKDPKKQYKDAISATDVQHNIGKSGWRNCASKRKKTKNWKGRRKIIFVCRWHALLCRKSWDSTKILLELINKFTNVAEYKINTKTNEFLYSSINNPKIKKTVPCAIVSKRIKYLG